MTRKEREIMDLILDDIREIKTDVKAVRAEFGKRLNKIEVFIGWIKGIFAFIGFIGITGLAALFKGKI